MKSHFLFVAIMAVLISCILAWIGHTRLQDFESYHTSLAQGATAAVASEIKQFVDEKKRLVGLFANQHLSLIQAWGNDPENEQLHRQLKRLIRDYFPNHFTFTLTDAKGRLKIDDFDNLIGERCQEDLRSFVKTHTQRPRIHPHSEVYHFDVLAPFENNHQEGILFISFDADLLGRALANVQTPHHRLMLIHPEAENLIEVIADGSRANWIRDDYRMSDQELAQIRARTPVPGTVWEAVDLLDPSLMKNYRLDLYKQSALLLVVFLLIGLSYLIYAYRNEQRRQHADRYKDEFISVISHELRTPLTSIRGSLGLIDGGATGEISDKTRDMIGIALKNCTRLIDLVNDILDVQKIEAGKMVFDLKPVEILPIVTQSLADNQAYATQYNTQYELVTDIPADLKVVADATKLEQVLANLLSNAAKYGASPDLVQVSIKNLRDYVRISVTDHGDGIAEAFRDRVFSKFAQSDGTDSRRIGGTGLGLNIVKLIVEHHNGFVSFDSRSGVGTTFHIDLPLYRQG